jgi:hypothetical protein
MLSRYDRIVFSLIALALAVIALNPWIAPGYVTAQSRTMDVNIARVSSVAGVLDVNIARIGGNRFSGPLPVTAK